MSAVGLLIGMAFRSGAIRPGSKERYSAIVPLAQALLVPVRVERVFGVLQHEELFFSYQRFVWQAHRMRTEKSTEIVQLWNQPAKGLHPISPSSVTAQGQRQ